MKNLFLLIVTAIIILSTVYYSQKGVLSKNALLFVGIVLVVTLIAVLIVSIKYADHSSILGIAICGFILALHVPVFYTLEKLAEVTDVMHYVITLSIASIIWVGTVILSYRHYFIVGK